MTYTLVPNRNLTVVTSDFKVLTIGSDNPNWKGILECIKNSDEAGVIRLMNLKETVRNFGKTTDELIENIEIRGNEVFYCNEKLHGLDVERILSFTREGIDAKGMVRFLNRKLQNPSKRSVDSLYGFLENRGMPVTPRGTFLGYKGLNGDFSSKNTGDEPMVTGIRLPNGSIDNHVGQSPRIPRRYVCDDFNVGCGPGLHVGSLGNALGWAGSEGRVVIVEVDPADVVSVPNEKHTKLRCCAYTVVGEYVRPLDDIYDSDYVRPDEETDETCDCGDLDCPGCGNGINIPSAGVRSDFQEGYEFGIAEGRSHKKRKYYESDKGRKFKKVSTTYVDGYCKGYREGRYG